MRFITNNYLEWTNNSCFDVATAATKREENKQKVK